MDRSLSRVATFVNWPKTSPISPVALADNGFFSTGHQDEVECYSCCVKIRNWKGSDSVQERHKQLSGQCDLVKDVSIDGQSTRRGINSDLDRLMETEEDDLDGNVECTNTQKNPGGLIPKEITRTNASPLVIRSNADVFKVMSQSNGNTQTWLNTRQLSESHSVMTDYTVQENRLASFNGRWVNDAPVTVADLVLSGLYFTGPGDRVQCAYCRGGLYNWSIGDTAIGEHVRHFPHCKFAKDKVADLLGKKTPRNTERQLFSETKSEAREDDEWINAPAVKIAQGMGYHLALIKKAAKKVLACSRKSFCSNTLMEAIFEIESSTGEELSDVESDNEENEGAVGGVNIPQEIVTRTECLSKTGSREGLNDEKTKNGDQNLTEPPINTRDLSEKQVKKLMDENQRLRGNTTCKVCLDTSVDTLFLPCRHLLCCEGCANAVKSCPLCRTLIIGTVKTFLT